MDITELLASLLNPNGQQSVLGPATAVGDHANPAVLQAQMAQFTQPPPVQQPQMQPPQAPQQQQPAPQAPQGQPMPQGAPQAAPAAPGGGMGDFLSNIFAPKQAAKTRTVGWLQEQGLDQGTATLLASDKGALRSYLLQKSMGKATEFDQRAAAAQQYGIDTNTPEGRNFILTGKYGEEPKQTSDMQEYDLAKQQGFNGTFFDYQVKMKEAGRNQVNIDTGAKLPTGYMWNDANDQTKGVHPIEGGPATVLPSEAAGRIGLADSFLKNFDTIRGKVASGSVTGPLDRFQATNNSSSEAGQIYQSIQTGVDSLQRMLTGAGMPASEASQYAFRYLPGYTDTAESMVAKLDRLKSELESVQTKVMQGRGGSGSPQQPSPDAQSGDAPPPSYTGKNWKYMTPEQRKLWQ